MRSVLATANYCLSDVILRLISSICDLLCFVCLVAVFLLSLVLKSERKGWLRKRSKVWSLLFRNDDMKSMASVESLALSWAVKAN
jgi:hypothetical protein